ncbi:MAG: DUF4440 domain-containing protein [Bdellovibrionota bacterium]
MSLEEYIKNLEQTLLEPSIRKSAIELNTLLADEFIEITSSGDILNKSQIIQALQNEQSVLYSLQDFRITLLASNVVLANYLSARTEISRPDETIYALRSSIWKCVEEKWIIVFHQGTPCNVLDLPYYKKSLLEKREKALEELALQAQELKMGYEK